MAQNLPTTRGTLQAAPPPSVTESQRRLLADSLRLEGETEVQWTPPKVGNPAAVKRVVDELDRGLQPARPIYLKWICDKLSALPTQTSNGLNAALWGDNVIDVCQHYPEDLLQTATLDLLRTKTFRPSPAEIVATIEPRYLKRQRMLDRARLLMAPIAKAAEPFKGEPLDVRLRSMRDSLVRYGHTDRAARYERELAAIEKREPEDWACGVATSNEGEKINTTPAPPIEQPAARDAGWRAGMPVYNAPMPRAAASDEPPAFDAIPEA